MPDVRNFKIIIEYDGSQYCGWQRQDNDPTIQETIEKALIKMTDQKISLIGSGRTDAGVHAYGQAANFRCDTKLTAGDFLGGLNSLTPEDIVIAACEEVAAEFHARFSATSKTYEYRILNRPNPAAIARQYAWHIRKPLDLDAMRTALPHLIGSHDFKAFEGAGSPRAHTTRNVLNAGLTEENNGYIVFEIEADGFLRYMVRNIVGTLVEVGLSKISPDDVKHILDSRDRTRAPATAPAHGLFLIRVNY
ncbi:MAG: tRNA pseudouridine(38-40) synthase TruA [Deltaproteobacteria bacterium]|jgi:tRNA pseudouridine38-40 synthase|nr:tRNA pseudouridine(38-40) synthase TruA [Deltaproteobacteria bacterium]